MPDWLMLTLSILAGLVLMGYIVSLCITAAFGWLWGRATYRRLHKDD